ncbi:hypothetical protein HS088_TW05G00074 [Tripterygium wilfordii]|uniref:NPH3 domain-containing protein n=1 Tax=Tripterygium wilfordii TaxID=458696 RepID=A0A7J7DM39_TRIWF|nr:hypothetical protein HS088_TW05G00074 [Tripterygium wilfordii]
MGAAGSKLEKAPGGRKILWPREFRQHLLLATAYCRHFIFVFHFVSSYWTALPENARACDNDLYRAIDTYPKACLKLTIRNSLSMKFQSSSQSHPSLSEQDRKRLCKLMNYKKLSLDACAHAAQNDRLPIRTVIQVIL